MSFSEDGRSAGERPPARWRRWVPFACLLAVIVTAICAATLAVPNRVFAWIHAHPGSDKAGHFILVGGLALALNWALRGRSVGVGVGRVQLGSAIVAVVITAEEVSQLWSSNRSFDWGDLAANYAGIVCADWLARRWLRSVRP